MKFKRCGHYYNSRKLLYLLIYYVLSHYNIACTHYTNKVNSTAYSYLLPRI